MALLSDFDVLLWFQREGTKTQHKTGSLEYAFHVLGTVISK